MAYCVCVVGAVRSIERWIRCGRGKRSGVFYMDCFEHVLIPINVIVTLIMINLI